MHTLETWLVKFMPVIENSFREILSSSLSFLKNFLQVVS